MRIAMYSGYHATPMAQAIVGMRRRRAFGQAADAAADIGAEITARVQDMVALNNDLYASAGSDREKRARVDAWHGSALQWMNLASLAAQDPVKLAEWERIGASIGSNAQDYAYEFSESAIGARARDFLVRLPDSVAKVAAWMQMATVATVKAAGNVVGEAVRQAGSGLIGAGVSLGTTAIVIVGAVALGMWFLAKSGTKIRHKYVSVG